MTPAGCGRPLGTHAAIMPRPTLGRLDPSQADQHRKTPGLARGDSALSSGAMSLPQRFFKAILPKSWAKDMEAQSRLWIVRCPCGHGASMWDLGGIRWKASGSPRMLKRCPAWGKRTFHTVSKETPGDAAPR